MPTVCASRAYASVVRLPAVYTGISVLLIAAQGNSWNERPREYHGDVRRVVGRIVRYYVRRVFRVSAGRRPKPNLDVYGDRRRDGRG